MDHVVPAEFGLHSRFDLSTSFVGRNLKEIEKMNSRYFCIYFVDKLTKIQTAATFFFNVFQRTMADKKKHAKIFWTPILTRHAYLLFFFNLFRYRAYDI